MDYAIGQVNFVLNLPDGQLNYSGWGGGGGGGGGIVITDEQ